jgi:hypothetical protein
LTVTAAYSIGFFATTTFVAVPQLFLPDVVVEPVKHVVVEGDHVDRKAGGALLTEHAVAPHLPDIPLLSYTVKKINDFPIPSRNATNQTLPGRDLAEWIERLTANGKVTTVLGSIPVSPTQCNLSGDR